MKIVVGSRGSKLALTQSNWVINKLKEHRPDIDFELKVVKTKGDRIQNVALDKIGDKGLFVKEIETLLLEGKIDVAIHSMKDMPSELPQGLKFTYIPEREDPRDVIILKEGYNTIDDLPLGAIIASGSKRRKYQLLKYRPDLNIVPIRGNIETRINKIESENLDGTILALAGINRLGLINDIPYKVQPVSMDIILPAPAQGALAIEIREGNSEIDEVFACLSHKDTEITVSSERAFLKAVDGSCHIPIGAYGVIKGSTLILTGLLGTDCGEKLVIKTIEGHINKPIELGEKLAKLILKELRQ